jgi:SpoVK/Ycf46/Vps4 family AAA+-type ATPase
VAAKRFTGYAEEMSNTRNRGRILWILASSRPDLIEVDLKRPGRIDVKIPLFPTTSTHESWNLMRALLKRRDLQLPETAPEELQKHIPLLLTPGAAESLSLKVYRLAKVEKLAPLDALKNALDDYRPPVPPEVLGAQIELAVREASDLEFVPESLRK